MFCNSSLDIIIKRLICHISKSKNLSLNIKSQPSRSVILLKKRFNRIFIGSPHNSNNFFLSIHSQSSIHSSIHCIDTTSFQ